MNKYRHPTINREGGPSKRTLGSSYSRVTQAVAKRRGIRRQAIRIGEVRGQFEPSVLAELHEDTKVV